MINHASTSSGHDRLRHGLAIALMGGTAALVFVGGSVTSNDAGMAVPDWPTTFGENMFLYHPRNWVGDILFEHVHRLAGATVGLITIAVAVMTQLRDERRPVRWFGWMLLAAVICQGVMGGYRVNNDSIRLAIIHGCFAHLFFCGTVMMVLITSRAWRQVGQRDGISVGLRWFSIATAIAVYGQVIAGAIYRHLFVGLAYHVVGACLTTLLICGVVMWVTGQYHENMLLSRLAKWLGGLLMVQLMLGVLAYVSVRNYNVDMLAHTEAHVATVENPDVPENSFRDASFFEWFMPSAHVLIGAGVLAMSVGLALCVCREPLRDRTMEGLTAEGVTAA